MDSVIAAEGPPLPLTLGDREPKPSERTTAAPLRAAVPLVETHALRRDEEGSWSSVSS